MSFASIIFLFYFLPFSLLGYQLIPKSWRRDFLLILSLIFYIWGTPQFAPLMMVSIFFDFSLVQLISVTNSKFLRKLLFIFVIAVNLGMLVYFKYANFIIDNYNLIFTGHTFEFERILLPLGISFFTFHKITYIVDSYRNVHKPFENLRDYAFYILFFPQLIAGPIIRFNEIADQIINLNSKKILNNEKISGLFRFVIGLAKKILIADVLAKTVDVIFTSSFSEIGNITLWIGAIGYAMQIYFDFSGYADMAIGLGKIFGLKFPENFNHPYTSASVTEFWQRWHMTLGTFMRNYIYIPLGGNRAGKFRNYLNLFIVFLISGFWHGASWNFVIWGVLHGIMIVSERMFLQKIYEKTGKYLAIFFTFIFITVSWVLFKIADLNLAFDYIASMFRFSLNINYNFELSFLFTLLISLILAFYPIIGKFDLATREIFEIKYSARFSIFIYVFFTVAYFVSLSFLISNNFSPFIYFQF